MRIWKGVPVMCGPRGLDSTPNVLYHNLGGGHFANVSKSSGIEKTIASVTTESTQRVGRFRR